MALEAIREILCAVHGAALRKIFRGNVEAVNAILRRFDLQPSGVSFKAMYLTFELSEQSVDALHVSGASSTAVYVVEALVSSTTFGLHKYVAVRGVPPLDHASSTL